MITDSRTEAIMDMSVRPVFIWVSEHDTESMIDECGNHDIYHVNTGIRWGDEPVDSITARRVQ